MLNIFKSREQKKNDEAAHAARYREAKDRAMAQSQSIVVESDRLRQKCRDLEAMEDDAFVAEIKRMRADPTDERNACTWIHETINRELKLRTLLAAFEKTRATPNEQGETRRQ